MGKAAEAVLNILHGVHPYREIRLGGEVLRLDLRWPHERRYLALSRTPTPLDMDVLCTRRLVRQGDVVLDAGASIGFTALLFLEAGASRVHAVEPEPRSAQRLGLLASERLEVHQCALVDHVGTLGITVSQSHNQGHSGNPEFVRRFASVYGKKPRTVEVSATTVDVLFGESRFDVMKIDVEGSEFALVKGAARALSEHPPRVLFIEVYDEFLEPTHAALARYFDHVRRVTLDRRRRRVRFVRPRDLQGGEGDLVTLPPCYVYANDPAVYA